jgi:serine/threonine protein kinase
MSDPLIGGSLGDYHIMRLLGRGGMARVYLGYDRRLDRYAAIKVIDPGERRNPDSAERFRREAQAIARLQHPNIVIIYQFGEEEDVYYMAMAFVEGLDLFDVLAGYASHKEWMPYDDVVRVVREVGSALDYAHESGVIHRDIKPSNIMLDRAGHVVLMDFGLALSVKEGSLGETFGTPHYMAPEQVESSAKAVPQSDLYALGVVTYEMLAGRVPFLDESAMSLAMMHVQKPPPSPRAFNPDLPPALDTVLLRMLAKDPQARYQSGVEFAEALRFALDTSPTGPRRPQVGSRRLSERPVTQWVSLHLAQQRSVKMPPSPPVVQSRKKRRPSRVRRLGIYALFMGILIVGCLFGGGALLLLMRAVYGSELAPTLTSMPPPVDFTITDAPTVTPMPTETMTPTVTVTPTFTYTPEPTVTAPPLVTLTPSVTLTPDPALPTLIPDPDIVLHYDSMGGPLTLQNVSERERSLEGITFRQVQDGIAMVSFDAERWREVDQASADVGSLPEGDCFDVWLFEEGAYYDRREICDARHAYLMVNANEAFWIKSENSPTVFEVLRDGIVISECPLVEDGMCGFKVP